MNSFCKYLISPLFMYFLVAPSVLGYALHGRSESKWDYSLELRVTRCFKMKDVKIICDGDTIDDVVNAELQITAVDGNGKEFAYGYGKSIEGNLCKEHLSRIQALVKKQDQVCITGDGENVLDSGETYVRWKELETRRGKISW